MNISTWTLKWGVPYSALIELQQMLGVLDAEPGVPGRSEAAVQANVRVEASEKGMRVFRNNSGVLMNEAGTPVRFGLANDSAKLNAKLKSGDLIGIDSRPITLADVGQPRGRFVSFECKPEGWRYTGTPREEAQQAWAALVLSLGGHARFVNRAGLL
jgi:hypothetical protein